VAEAALADMAEAGGFPGSGRVLVLAGKGNNAGDALIAARDVLARHPGASCDVLFAFGPRRLKGPASRAWRGLADSSRGRARAVGPERLAKAYDLCLDGIFGYSYRPPLPPEAAAAIAAAANCTIRFRAAVDLPSGLEGKGAFHADFTYATGIAKDPILHGGNAGRPRYLDLGFFEGEAPGAGAKDRVILASALAPLAGLRPASSDKRSQGHLAIVGGSEGTPGAVLLCTLAALRSGAGLVSVFVPESLAAAYAARAPEAMWVGMPVTSRGGLSPRGLKIFEERSEKATVLAIGPGIGMDPKTQAFAKTIVQASSIPLVIDAEALQPDIVRAGKAKRILTPHAGELARIHGTDLARFSGTVHGAVIAKGPVTRVCAGGPVYHCLRGGPVLSRGGSGDILCGLAGGLLAQSPAQPLLAACRAALWHGTAADLLARAKGQAAVEILELLDHLSPALRQAAPWRAN
jgi:NAD(P)H-hydrate epimerase